MHIKILSDFTESANVGIAEIAVILNNLFGKYEQVDTLEEVEKVCQGPVIMPIMAFGPLQILLRTKAIKNTNLVGRFAVYSKKPEDQKECLRFILKERYVPREEMLLDMLPAVRDATFKHDSDETIGDVLTKIGSIKSDKVSYYYNPFTCEGFVSHCMAVIHEFGEEDNPHCVCTSYFKVDVSK